MISIQNPSSITKFSTIILSFWTLHNGCIATAIVATLATIIHNVKDHDETTTTIITWENITFHAVRRLTRA
ncbi:hypothetical protein HKD37_13G036532 [Glycine soja]